MFVYVLSLALFSAVSVVIKAVGIATSALDTANGDRPAKVADCAMIPHSENSCVN